MTGKTDRGINGGWERTREKVCEPGIESPGCIRDTNHDEVLSFRLSALPSCVGYVLGQLLPTQQHTGAHSSRWAWASTCLFPHHTSETQLEPSTVVSVGHLYVARPSVRTHQSHMLASRGIALHRKIVMLRRKTARAISLSLLLFTSK